MSLLRIYAVLEPSKASKNLRTPPMLGSTLHRRLYEVRLASAKYVWPVRSAFGQEFREVRLAAESGFMVSVNFDFCSVGELPMWEGHGEPDGGALGRRVTIGRPVRVMTHVLQAACHFRENPLATASDPAHRRPTVCYTNTFSPCNHSLGFTKVR